MFINGRRVQAGSSVRLFALLCAIYVAHNSAQISGPTDVEKRSTAHLENKRDFRPDLGKRGADEDGDEGSLQPYLLMDRQQRSRGRFDLGKRLSSFRGDLGKRRRFRGDLGKRAYDDVDDQLTAQLEKRRGSSFRCKHDDADVVVEY